MSHNKAVVVAGRMTHVINLYGPTDYVVPLYAQIYTFCRIVRYPVVATKRLVAQDVAK